jgi:hypothetical protein
MHTLSGKIPEAIARARDEHADTVRRYFRPAGARHNPAAAPMSKVVVPHPIQVSLENVMKKSILFASLLMAFAALAGCTHPNDIIDDVAQAAAPTAQA